MTVSSSSNFSLGAHSLVRAALRRIGHSAPTDQEILDGRESLNMIAKRLDATARWLWAIAPVESTLTLVQDQEAYDVTSDSLAGDIVRLEKVSYMQGTNRTHLSIVSSDDFLDSYDRDDTGEPYAVYLEQNPDRTLQKVRFLPTPGGSYTINYTYRRALYDFDTALDTPDFPQEWYHALKMIVSADLANDYGLPIGERQLLKSDALVAERERVKFNAASDKGPDYTLATIYY